MLRCCFDATTINARRYNAEGLSTPVCGNPKKPSGASALLPRLFRPRHLAFCLAVSRTAGARQRDTARGFGANEHLFCNSPHSWRCCAIVRFFVCRVFAALMLLLMLCAETTPFSMLVDAPCEGAESIQVIRPYSQGFRERYL